MTVALAATALVSAQAQSEFKPLAGSVTTDFSLFANGIFNQTESPVALGSHADINGLIKGRYFLQDNIALRLSLGLNNSSSTEKKTDPVDETTKKSNVFTFGLGLEHHFGGTDRLSPYIGAELFLGSATGSTKSVNSVATSISKNAPRFVFGGDLLLGADYYIAPHVYLGVEAGLELLHASTGKTSVTVTPAGGTATTNESKSTSSAGGFATDVKAGFKVGFVF